MSKDDNTPVAAAESAEHETSAQADSAKAVEPAPTNSAPEQAQEATLEEQLASARQKAQENLEGWQRTLAEFQNYRKRVDRDLKEGYQRAALDMALRLLPIIDDFERGMANIPDQVKGTPWLEGIELIQRKFQKILDDLEIVAIDPVGEAFDPSRHEAVGVDADTNVASGRVTITLQKGYVYGERVLRPALVRVAQ